MENIRTVIRSVLIVALQELTVGICSNWGDCGYDDRGSRKLEVRAHTRAQQFEALLGFDDFERSLAQVAG